MSAVSVEMDAGGLSAEGMFIDDMERRNIPASALIDVRFVHGVCVITHTLQAVT